MHELDSCLVKQAWNLGTPTPLETSADLCSEDTIPVYK